MDFLCNIQNDVFSGLKADENACNRCGMFQVVYIRQTIADKVIGVVEIESQLKSQSENWEK